MKPILLAAVLLSASPALALVFDNGNGTLDWNDPVNWENDTIPGTVGGEDAVIGRVGSSGGVPFANQVTVSLDSPTSVANPIGSLVVGSGPGGDGVFEHSGGDLITAPGVSSFLGVDGTAADPAFSQYTLSGDATFTQTDGAFHLGFGGGPRTGGTVNEGFLTVRDDAVFNGDSVFVGSNDGNRGRVRQFGGTFNAESGLSIGGADRASGLYTISGSGFSPTLNVQGDGITVGGPGGSGTLSIGIYTEGATVNTTNLRIAPFELNGNSGNLVIQGDNHIINATELSVAANDGSPTSGLGEIAFSTGFSPSGQLSPIVVSGDVTLNDGSSAAGGFAMLSIRQLGPGFLLADDEILLIDVGGTLTGTFFNMPEGSPVIVPGSGFSPTRIRYISYQGGDGNDVVLLPYLPGDADGDGDVDGDDLISVQTNFGTNGEPFPRQGDADSDGDVDGDDLIAVQTNFGTTLAAAVPEPATAALATLLLLSAGGVPRRSRPSPAA